MKQLKKIGKYWWDSPCLLAALTLLILGMVSQPSLAAVTVSAVVEHQQVYVGESFILQIQVEGDDSPERPDLSALQDFTVTPQGGQKNNSSSVSIINGHMSQTSHHGYVFNYALIPRKAGHLTIPELEIKTGSGSYFTMPVTIVATPPEETSDFKLRLGLAKKSCYVGEPVKLTITWYIGKDVQGFNFNLPILDDERFSVRADPAAPSKANNDNLLAIPLGKGQVVAQKSHGTLNGRDFLTVSFSRILVPLVPGKLALPEATVSAKAFAGRKTHGNSYDPFNNFFNDGFFGRSRDIYRTVVVPSDTPTLTVLPLPELGKPANFNGLVGDYSLLATASPTQVKIGDPITLTIQVAGSYANNVSLPPLQDQLPTADFKVPVEMAPGVGEGMLKTFTQTVRARRAGIKEIPALSLSFFNSKSGKYETVKSKAIPLKVSGNRVVTAQDAEGGGGGGITKKDIHGAKGGINYNYEDQDALVNQDGNSLPKPDSFYAVALVGGPALLYALCFLTIQIIRARRRDPARRKSRQAYSAMRTTLNVLEDESDSRRSCELLSEALKNYMSAKLKLNSAVLSYADVEPILVDKGVERETMEKLKGLLAQCEAGQYAGGMTVGQTGNLLAMAEDVVRTLESKLKAPKF